MPHRFELAYQSDKLCLQDPSNQFKPLYIDFGDPSQAHRRLKATHKPELLAKAVGTSRTTNPR